MSILKKILFLLIFIMPILASGYEQVWKEYEPYPVIKSKPIDTDGDGIPDIKDPDDDNDGYSDEEEEEAGSI